MRLFTNMTQELTLTHILDKGIYVTGYSLILVVAGGIFGLKPDDSYLSMLSMMGSAALGILIAELVDNAMQASHPKTFD